MNALQRRREMMLQTAEEVAPLYEIYQGEHNSPKGRTITISGNHIDDAYTGGASDENRFVRLDGTIETFYEVITTTWFSLHAGDVVTMRRKNMTFQNNYRGANTICETTLEDTLGNKVISLSVTARSQETITPDDAEASVTLANDTDISCILFYTNRLSYGVYDLELEVNGVRYI